jgi:hypothetical protein
LTSLLFEDGDIEQAVSKLYGNAPIDKDKAPLLYDIGYSDQKIADELNVNSQAVQRWRKKD